MQPKPLPKPTEPPVRLEYARRPTPRLRYWLVRLVLLGWAAGLLALAYDKWGVLVRVRVALVVAQQQAIRNAPRPDQVVFESHPDAAADLLAGRGYRKSRIGDGFWSQSNPSTRPSAVSLDAARVGKQLSEAVKVAEEYDELNRPPEAESGSDKRHYAYGFEPHHSGPDDVVPVFIGVRQAPGAPPRLVEVDAGWLDRIGSVRFMTQVFPYSWTGDCEPLPSGPITFGDSGVTRLWLSGWDRRMVIRLYGGAPDPADAARLTVRYEVAGRSGTIEGRLRPDDLVVMTLLDGPLWEAERAREQEWERFKAEEKAREQQQGGPATRPASGPVKWPSPSTAAGR